MTAVRIHAPAAMRGFVLPVVAIVIAVFALSVLTLVSTIDASAVRARRLADDAAFERRAVTAEARVAFLLATEPLRASAIAVGADRAAPIDTPLDLRDRQVSPVYLDGRVYETLVEGRPMRVSLQDTAGLLNVNGADPARLARLLAVLGDDAAAAGRATQLLADFIDADDLRRPGGAERGDYARRGAPAPDNAPLIDGRQVHDVLDWDTLVSSAQTRRLARLSRAADPDEGLNVNTAPIEVLEAAFALDEQRAAEIVRRRIAQPIRTSDDLAAVVGGGLDVEGQAFAAAPDSIIRLDVRPGEPGADRRRMTTSLTFAKTPENPPIGVGPRDNSPDPDQRSSDERPEPLPAGGRRPPR